jgi:hypothetical protein
LARRITSSHPKQRPLTTFTADNTTTTLLAEVISGTAGDKVARDNIRLLQLS